MDQFERPYHFSVKLGIWNGQIFAFPIENQIVHFNGHDCVIVMEFLEVFCEIVNGKIYIRVVDGFEIHQLNFRIR